MTSNLFFDTPPCEATLTEVNSVKVAFFYTGSLKDTPFCICPHHRCDYQAIFHSSMRRVLVEKLTPILKSLRGSATKGRA